MTTRRALDGGNAWPNKIAEDFRRFGFELWPIVEARGATYTKRKERLEILMIWRNSLAHDSQMSSANAAKTAGTNPTKRFAREWRKNCDVLAVAFDQTLEAELHNLLGRSPW